jgi:DNA-binding MarR family transcriptional regulator
MSKEAEPQPVAVAGADARRLVGARIALRILRASHIMERDANRIAQQAGLTLQQWFLLNLLVDEGGTTSMGRMAKYATVTRQNVAAMVQRMVSMGVVSTARDPKDRRSALVTITPEGRKKIEESTGVRDNWTEEVFKGLNDPDLQTADRILRTIYRSVAQRADAEEGRNKEPDTLW